MPLIRKTPDPAVSAAAPAADLAVGLARTSPDARWAAVRSAAERPGSEALLGDALAREDDVRVREAIFTALVRMATPESVLVVLPYVRSDNANLRTGAMDALRAMPALLATHLATLLADPDSDVRLLVCDLARAVPGPKAQQHLTALLESEAQPNVCAAAVEVLTEIGDTNALPALAQCADRFPNDPFLLFAIKTARERLAAHDGRG
jgi:HEAT repeat protein